MENDRLQKVIYAAGYFDGEGCVYVSSLRGVGFQIRISIAGYDTCAMNAFADLWGGKVSLERRKKNKYLVSRWQIASQNAIKALREMHPYLLVKKEQAGMVLESGWEKCEIGTLTDEQVRLRMKLYLDLRAAKHPKGRDKSHLSCKIEEDDV